MTVDDFFDVLVALEAAGARYVVVGSGATVLHGHARDIEDLDVVVDPAPAECNRIANALMQLGFFPTVPLPLPQVVVMRFVDQGERRVDVHVRYYFPFDQLAEKCVRLRAGDATASVVALDDLIEIKKRRRPDDPDIGPLSALRRVR